MFLEAGAKVQLLFNLASLWESFLKKYIGAPGSKFYVCGPPPMMDAIQKILNSMGVGGDSVVVEI